MKNQPYDNYYQSQHWSPNFSFPNFQTTIFTDIHALEF